MKNLKVLFTVLCVACATSAWGVTSGTTYTLTTTNGVPTGWTNSGCSLGSNYTSISNGDYLTTDDICVGSLKSIQINARYYGGSGNTAAIKFEFITSDGKTTYNLGTLTPTTNQESASYTLSSFTQSISAKSKGYFKISAPNATSSKYAGLKAITFTFTFTTGTCGSTETTNYTVQWKVGGQAHTAGNPTTSVKSGEKVSTLPTAPDNNAIGDCADTFMGWSTHNLGSKKDQPAPKDLFTTAEGSPVIAQDTTFYAVFATKKQQ